MRSFRFTISGIMGAVIVVSLVLTALRSSEDIWASVTLMLAVWALSLGVVGVACGREADRAWWLGFSLFGWGYLALAYYPLVFPYYHFSLPQPPTSLLLSALKPYVIAPAPLTRSSDGFWYREEFFGQVGHNLWSVVVAAFGGVLARALFVTPTVRPTPLVADRQEVVRSPRRSWRRPLILITAAFLVFTSVALAGATKRPGLSAGVTVVLTWGVLGLTAIAAVHGRGRRRSAFLGATLFGVGYLFLVQGRSHDSETWPQCATVWLLNEVRPWLPTVVTELPGRKDSVVYANARVFLALDQRISMPFRQETPLEEVLKYIMAATSQPDWPGVPIYVDPIGLQEAEKTMTSPVTIVMEDVPLRTTLNLILRQLGMTYCVKDGLITITSQSTGQEEDTSFYEDPFLVIGQCVLALLAACLGGVLAPLVSGRRDEQTG